MADINYTKIAKRPCFSEKCKGENTLHQLGFQPSTGKRWKACIVCDLETEAIYTTDHQPVAP